MAKRPRRRVLGGAEELEAAGDQAGVAVWHRINDAIEQLANMTPLGPVN
jgi:hypothetical protein